MVTLSEHRKLLKANKDAYTEDIERCYRTAVKHLKDAGYNGITLNRAYEEVKNFVDLIFATQENKPFFHIESDLGLPFCWNSPSKGGWDINYIRYEWGHLRSKNQNIKDYKCIMNLCLQSARCNQHIQSSMNVVELLEYGGKLKEVIERNLARREALFNSDSWRSLIESIEPYKI